jgi:hypothetical protein
MKNIRMIILAGVASMTLASAAHACEFTDKGSRVPIVLGDLGLSGPSTTAQIATQLKQKISYATDCSPADIEAKLLAVNGWKTSVTVPVDYRFSIPLVTAPSTAAPEPAASPAPQVTASAGVAQAPPESAPSVEKVPLRIVEKPIYTTTTVQAGLSAADKLRLENLTNEGSRLQGEIDIINALPSPNAEQLAQLAVLTDQKSGIQAQILSLSGRVNILQNEVSGMWSWIFGIIFVMVSGFGFISWRKPSRKALAETMPDMSSFVTLETFEERFEGLESRFTHVVKKLSDTHQPQNMKAMKDGDKFTYHIQVDGAVVDFNAEKISTTPSGDALIKVDVLASPVTGKQLFGAMADYVENGGLIPMLKAANL